MLDTTNILLAYQVSKALIAEPHRRDEIFQDYLERYPGLGEFLTILRARLKSFSFDNQEHISLHREAIRLVGMSMQGDSSFSIHEAGVVLVQCSEGGDMANLDLSSIPTGPVFLLDAPEGEDQLHKKVSDLLKDEVTQPDYLSLMSHKDPVEILVNSWKYEDEEE